ncbi:MAG: tRNA uridine-5-carboxymethylaminomethyl(34) synthesis GTPase MnmE [Azospirillaceae bacterium]|nr:tRNA uridine-5-carboxymethylaminomethyl(34) synthesis GTPase MnmE [Azospirillaceae bacterium]
MPEDTIFALASAAGRAGVAVIRVSGPGAGAAVRALTDRPVPEARRASLRHLADPASGERLDDALVLWFPGPASFTGEDVVEFHVHGGRAILTGVTEALAALPGLRPAGPGDFSRRAFEQGRLDLTAVEAIADLVDAETAAQRRQALRQMDGALGQLYEGWRERLLRALAHLEADIDFADEDLPDGVASAVLPVLAALARAIGDHLDDRHRGERLRTGLQVAIVGAPNVGKSSLLNAIAGREVAIVSALAGTTRDVIEVHLDLGGYPVTLADTAGLRDATDEIESEGVRRALARAAAADLKLVLFDGTAGDPDPGGAGGALVDQDALVVVTKRDQWRDGVSLPAGALGVSARSGEGVATLLERIADLAASRLGSGDTPALTRTRHRAALERCQAALQRAQQAPLPELVAEDVRLAMRCLGEITGRVDVEQLLDVIFRDFCIGK